MKTNRRDMLLQTAAVAGATLAGAAALSTTADAADGDTVSPQLRYCLNTSTIAGHRNKTPLDKEVALIAKAGYSGIEPWLGEIKAFKESGGKLSDLKKQLSDSGVAVESAIGFAKWIVDDETNRKKGLESLKRDMDLVRQIGGTRMAAPPVGAKGPMDLDRVAERYGAALRVGQEMGVTPMLELWGHSKTLHRLGEISYILVESNEPNAAMLLDVYHIYRGGSDFSGLRHMDGKALEVLHMNDYPDIPHQDIKDADRVYVGEGVAPVPDILRTMIETGFSGVLSLELFNPTYWEDDIENVLRVGLAGMKKAVAQI